MLLLNLVAGKVTFLVVFHESHGINEGVNFLAADTIIVLGVVELLGTCGGIRARDRITTEGNIVVPVAQNGGELTIGVLINPNLDTDILHLLGEGLSLTLGGRVVAEDHHGAASLHAVLLVVVTILGVAGGLQNLLRLRNTVIRGRVRILVVGREGHVNHRTGNGFLIGQTLELNLGKCLTIHTGKDCLTQGSILDAAGVNIQTTGVEAGALTQFSTSNVLNLRVRGGSISTDTVNFVVLERGTCSAGLHLSKDNLVQQGLGAPPLVVGHNAEGLRGGVPTLIRQGKGASPVLGVRVIDKAIIEELGVFQGGVQNLREEALQRVVGLGEGDGCTVVIFALFYRFNEFVNAAGDDIVAIVQTLEDVPGGLESLVGDGGAVVEDSLGVELDGNLNLVVLLAVLERDSEIGIQLVGTVKVEVPQASLADGAHNIDVIGGVTALGVVVEVRADESGGQAQSAALLQAIHVLSVDVVEVFDIGTGTGCLGLFRACATVAAGTEQAYSSQSRGAANEGAAAEAVLGRFVATRGVCGLGGHGSGFLLFCAGGCIPYPQGTDYLCRALHNFV